MKLFFYAAILFVTVTFLSGCGTSAGNEGRGYSTQMAEENTANGTKALPEVYEPKAAVPEFPNFQSGRPETTPFGSTIPEAAEKLNSNLRNSNPETRPERVVAENVRLGRDDIGGMSENQLRLKLQSVAVKTNVAAINASYNAKTWAVRKEKAGKRLNTNKMIEAAMAADAGQKIQYSYSPVYPKITQVQLRKNIRMIAKFKTPFLDRSKPRIRNIRRVSAKLDRKIVMPGQVFSFNKATGSKSKKAGYENATVIVRTPMGPKHKKAPGGGVCQVSTTLYNAVLKCGLKVTERHEHSDDVYYVPDGKDATVMYGGADFKFVNNRSFPVMIRVYVGRTSLQVRVYENSANTGR